MSSGDHTAVERRCLDVLDKEGLYSHSSALTNVVGIARLFKDKDESDDKDGTTRVDEVRLHLQPNSLHHLGYVP